MALTFSFPALYLAMLSSTWAASLTNPKHPTSYLWRLLAVALNGICVLEYINNAHKYIDKPSSRANLGTAIIGTAFASLDKLFLSRWSLDAGGPEKHRRRPKPGSRAAPRPKLTPYTIDFLPNPRGIGRPWQVKNVPHFSSSDPQYVPSRRRFLTRAAVILVLCVLTMDAITQMTPKDPELYSLELIPLFGRTKGFSIRELIFRMQSTVIFWLNTALNLEMNVLFAAFIAVGIGLNSPKDWPPLFGSTKELYTVRKFWGTVWHQNLRVTFDSISTFFTHDVLRIPSGTLLARYLKIWIAFFTSGLIHAGMAEATYHIRGSGTVQFFCTQALGIMIEDGVQELWRLFMANRGIKYETQTWHKFIGFVWLLLFMTWSTPVWSYRMFQHFSPVIYSLLPFSIISHFR